MELFQRDHIRKNLSELQFLTDCHVSLISYLQSKSLLGDYDAECLKIIDNRFDKAAKFYDIIVDRTNSYWIVRDALKETVQTGAEAIFNQLETSPVATCSLTLALPDFESRIRKRIRYVVRRPVQLFTGREAEIALLHEHMSSQEKTTIITQTASVTGLGGIGKSELCRKYIELHSEYYDGNVIWIQAEREIDKTRDFRTVAKDHLKIPLKNEDGSEKSIKTIADEVYNYFNEKKVLFVFDNAVSSDDEHLDIFLPTRVTTNPSIIITSRDRDFQEMPSKILVIGELKEEEAVEFVKKGLDIQDNCQDEMIKKLVKRLQYFPLAIQQAVSFIKERGKLRTFDIAEYLSLFETNTRQLLNSKGKGTRLSTNNYSLTTYTTWKITMKLIASEEEFGKLSIKCLSIMSYFQPERIPMQLFYKCGEISSVSVFEVDSALQLLVKYSMINSQPTEKMLNIHRRLVQEVTRIHVKAVGKEEQVLHNCFSVFLSGVDDEDVGHAKSVVEFSVSNTSLLKQFPLVPCFVGETLMFLGSKDCVPFCEKVHKTLSLVLAEGAVELIHLEFFLARELLKSEKYDKCLEALHQVLAKYGNIQSSKKDVFFVWRTNLAIVEALKKLERFKEALDIVTSIFREKVAFPIAEEPIAEAALAFDFYLILRNYKGALDWCKEIMAHFQNDEDQVQAQIEEESCYIQEIWKRVSKLMELHENCYSFGIILADHFAKVGKEKDSLHLSTTIYEIVSKIYGEEHSTTLRQLVAIGLLYIKMGEYEQAVTIYRKPGVAKMVEIEDFEIGQETNQPVGSVFAKALSKTGAHQEALELLAKGLDSFTEKNGDENEYVVGVVFQVAQVYANMDNYEEALLHFKKAEKVAAKLENFDPDFLQQIRFITSQLSQFLSASQESIN